MLRALLVLALAAGSAQEARKRDIRLPASPTAKLALKGDPNAFALRDVNGDGFPDLFVAANAGGRASPSYLFLSKKGRFDAEPSWTPAEEGVATSIAVADFDGDDVDDIFLGRSNSGGASIYRGKGKGEFEREPFWTAAEDDPADQVVVGDFDGDGDMDIFAGDHDKWRIYRGARGGPAREGEAFVDKGDAWATRVVRADVDGDGRADLVMTHYSGPAFQVYPGTKEGFAARPSAEAALSAWFYSLAVGDLDGDGFPEMAVGTTTFDNGDGRLRLYGNKKGKPTAEPVWMSDDADVPMNALVLHDMDADGDLDLFVLADDHTGIYENVRGTLATQPVWRASISGNNCFNGHVATIEDLDRNGWPDLIVAGDDEVLLFYGGPDVPVAKADPLPAAPKLAPLTRRDLMPEMDAAVEKALDDYRAAATAAERKSAIAAIEPRAVETLNAIFGIDDPSLDALRIALQPEGDKLARKLLPGLKGEGIAERQEAARELTEMGPAALAALEEAARSPDAEIKARAAAVRDSIQAALRKQRLVAVDMAGLRVAALTPRLRKRYGIDAMEGVVVVEAPEDAWRTFKLGNLREGDVIVGIGPESSWRKALPVPRDPAHFLELVATHGSGRAHSASFTWRCGPLHPTESKKQRDGRMKLESVMPEIEKAARSPVPWRPPR